MAGIYNRDNIQYGSLLDAMLNRRAQRLKEEQELNNQRTQHIVEGLKMLGRTAAMAYGGSGAAAELSQLEAQKAALIEAEQQKAAEQMADYTKAVPDNYSSIVGSTSYGQTGYAPTYGREANVYALPGNSNANQSQWLNYQLAMNKLLGGR